MQVDDAPALLPAVGDGLKAALAGLPEGVRQVAAYQLGLPGAGEPESPGRGGKAVRAALVLSAAAAVGGNAEVALPGAVAVELVHNFTLLHDDIIDGDRMRRHRPAAWVRFGIPAAMLTGDALLVLAVRVLLESGSARAQVVMTGVLESLVRGQAEDVAFTGRVSVSVEDYRRMAGAKTGALLAGACEVGGVLAGASAAQARALAGFGYHLGIAFQCDDDVLGIWGDPARTGKPVGTDLAAHRKSFPVVAALAADVPAAQRARRLCAQPGPLSRRQVRSLAGAIDKAGGREAAEAEAEQQHAWALDSLREGAVPCEGLAELADRLVRRSH
ncbi:polyprenyl synthetase family protein [Streptomyces sp. ISL-98]|uniref:polyprenyl synthetase family protein n=1 Tax=Streptomyces sp. ISL-98 TaxID=2819192 RepID=UPI001BE7F5D1|nr:polyprenyl synthetase family protein [Streptomyces sp. ISL-98]MBT2511954.1 polyprenyl synthetase family protein [Streptomyces sp. ISL-98]